jgi:general nucleoside transport system permease protein
VLGEGLSKAGTVSLLPNFSIPLLSQIPILGPIFFTRQSVLVYIGYLMIPLAWYYINRTRPGLHLRAVGEYPAAADALGINVFRMRYAYVFVGGMLAGLGGATISLAVAPGWFSELTTAGQGWIAVGLVIFAQWDPGSRGNWLVRVWRTAPSDPRYPGPAYCYSVSTILSITTRTGVSSCRCFPTRSPSSCW